MTLTDCVLSLDSQNNNLLSTTNPQRFQVATYKVGILTTPSVCLKKTQAHNLLYNIFITFSIMVFLWLFCCIKNTAVLKLSNKYHLIIILSYLEVRTEAKQEGFSCAVAVFTDFEWI